MREAAGPGYPIWSKIHADDFEEGGSTFEDCMYVCRTLDNRGIDLIEMSGGNPARRRVGAETPEGYFGAYAAKAAEALRADVVSVGGWRSMAHMEKLFAETKIKGFALSRPFIREPDLVNKWIADPAYKPLCISCSQCFKPKPGGTACIFNAPAS
jgi:2,4-dienoyl-CoA reductase-like NADH-dependent reductase (Old Yellow Enzyme family)